MISLIGKERRVALCPTFDSVVRDWKPLTSNPNEKLKCEASLTFFSQNHTSAWSETWLSGIEVVLNHFHDIEG